MACFLFDTVKKEMKKLKFIQSYCESAIYLNSKSTYFVVYIHDLHIADLDLYRIYGLKEQLASKFITKDFRLTSYHLSIEVLCRMDSITITQRRYIDPLFASHQRSNLNST